MSAELHTALAERADPRHTALVVIDVQYDFCDPDEFPASAAILPRLAWLIDRARAAGVPVIYTRNAHGPLTDSPVWLSRYDTRPHRRGTSKPGSRGAEIHPQVAPADGDIVVTKHRYSAFVGTPFEVIVRAHAIQTLVFTGIATNICVESTLRDAFQREFNVVLVQDCTATNVQRLQDATEENVRTNFGLVCTAEEVAQVWAPSGAQEPAAVGAAYPNSQSAT